MLTRKAIAGQLLLLLGLTFPVAASAQTIVWTDGNGGRIQRKDVSGGSVSTIAQFNSNQFPHDVHFDPLSRDLYYRLFSEGSSGFRRCNVDGSETEIISTPTAGTFTVNVDMRKLHWIDSLTTIHRSSLDGTDIESHTYPSCCVRAVEAIEGDLFFMTSGTMPKAVWRADFDGTNQQFLHNAGSPGDLAYDPVDKKVYFSSAGGIDRINMDGTGYQQIVHLPPWEKEEQVPDQIEIDHAGRKLYWIDSVAKLIQRSNLDGSNIENFVSASEAGNTNIELMGLTIVQSPTIPAISAGGLMGFLAVLLIVGSVIIRKQASDRHGQ